MASSSSCTPISDSNTKDLEALLAAFCSMCTVEDIAAAYCKAGFDVTKAGDLLFQAQESISYSASNEKNGETDSLQFEEPCHEKPLKKSNCPNGDFRYSKPRKISASLGTVSGVLGNKYVRPSPSCNMSNVSRETVKPLKFEITKSLLDENNSDPVDLKYMPRSGSPTDKDIEGFLFSMLGEGFQLDKDVIYDVLGRCGYNIKQSMDELLKLSTKTLDKGKSVVSVTENLDGVTDNGSTMSTCLYKEHSSISTLTGSMNQSKLSNEVLQSLFSVPERSEEEEPKKHIPLGFNRTRVVGQKVITKPLDIDVSLSDDVPRNEDAKNVVDEEDEYQVLRRAAKQHWEAMKTYYEAAIDAFTRGDGDKANYFLEQGRYYNQKAREADAKSNAEIIEPRKRDSQDEITLDLQGQSLQDTLNLLKLNLHSLANIITFRYLKVIIGAGSEDRKLGRKRRLVIQLLDKESIKWHEDDNNLGILYIQIDQVDRSKLSFAKDVEARTKAL